MFVNLPEQIEIDNNDESEGGLDSDSDMEDNKIYLETREGFGYSYEPEYVNHVEFINAITKSDITSGKRDNPININFISREIMTNIDTYIKYHKGEDYIPSKENPNEVLTKKMTEWDISYFKHILEINEKPLDQLYPNIEKYIMAARYLMYDTFLSKLNCFVAHIPNMYVKKQDFISLFTIEEESESEEEVDIQMDNLNLDTDMVIIDGVELERKEDK